jgi:hypothetical protein
MIDGFWKVIECCEEPRRGSPRDWVVGVCSATGPDGERLDASSVLSPSRWPGLRSRLICRGCLVEERVQALPYGPMAGIHRAISDQTGFGPKISWHSSLDRCQALI